MGRRRRDRWVRHTGPHRYSLSLGDQERTLLRELVDQLRRLLAETTDDPTVRRLFPTAYNEDPERDQAYQVLARDELLERRLAALDATTATIDATELDLAALSAWSAAVNDLRLVLGTRLDVQEDQSLPDPDDADAPAYAVYAWLTELLDGIIEALSDGLADGPVDGLSDDPAQP
jgi:hypothetical protein